MSLKQKTAGEVLEAAGGRRMAMASGLEVGLVEESGLEEWDQLVSNHEQGNIHQTRAWGRFQEAKGEGWGFWIVGVWDEGRLVAGALVLKRALPMRKCWFYVPQGPLVNYFDSEGAGKVQMEAILAFLRDLAKQEKAVFLRVEPCLTVGWRWKELGFKGAHAHYQPENTLMIDLSGSENDILAQMKPKGRYNIKLAEKKGVEVKSVDGESGELADLEAKVTEFYGLLSETTARDGFSGHGRDYYLNMLLVLKDKAKLYIAYWGGVPIAGILVTFFKDKAIYYFGVSGDQHRNLMAPYLLQWKAMQEAKNRGIKWYDLLGIAPEGAGNKHEWAGVTEFKLKFGGVRIDYFPGQELIYKPMWYWLMLMRKKLGRG
ncbi:peptidoglycan bridge formation glycyltransferase FemA/FemB family protein [Candidatus Peregrinibacteria bacterium]|nr:peptidoglycan bridge formation glycyltransferase FemA/FemB family protein [Candidatus Peregrinibacteria bacterium]